MQHGPDDDALAQCANPQCRRAAYLSSLDDAGLCGDCHRQRAIETFLREHAALRS